MSKREPKMPTLNESRSCTRPNLTIIALAVYNANKALTKMPARCSEHNLFHNWAEPIDYTVHNEKLSQMKRARENGYFRLRSGHYLHDNPKKVKAVATT